jgi:hypothetical protein
MRRFVTTLLAAGAVSAALIGLSHGISRGLVKPSALGRTRLSGVSGAMWGAARRAIPDRDRLRMAYARMPLCFEANQGQEDPRVRFVARGNGYGFFLTQNEAVLSLVSPAPREGVGSMAGNAPAAAPAGSRQTTSRPETAVVRMKLLGANLRPVPVGLAPLPGKVNYLMSEDPAQWHTGIRHYGRVRYDAIYPGIDLIYYGNQSHLEYDFCIAPGADPNAIQLSFEGARKLEIDPQGDLVLHTAVGPLRQRKPRIYQEIDGIRRPVEGRYALLGKGQVGFRVGAYDTQQPLVIDPVLAYSSVLGGTPVYGGWGIPGEDCAYGLAVDGAGCAYIVGQTFSTNFPTKHAYQATYIGRLGGLQGCTPCVFVAKFDPTAIGGASNIYSTYLHSPCRVDRDV